MEITFYRQGHANNSSSSHSLIFAPGLNGKSDEDREFGWQNFTAADKSSKLNYILICLFRTWDDLSNIRSDNWSNKLGFSYDDLLTMKYLFFEKWFLKNFSDLELDLNIIKNGYVDHQSIFTFPLYRDATNINIELAREIINELINNDYLILGGNDNDGEIHNLKDCDTNSKLDFKNFWFSAMERDVKSLLSAYDSLTEEYIISDKSSGSLIKIKF